MLTPDQVAILLLAWVGAATVVCLFLAAGTGPTMGFCHRKLGPTCRLPTV